MKERKKKKTLSHEVVCFQMLVFETSNSKSEVSKFVENFSFLENYVTSEGAVSHNVLNYQQLVTKQRFMLIIILSNYLSKGGRVFVILPNTGAIMSMH